MNQGERIRLMIVDHAAVIHSGLKTWLHAYDDKEYPKVAAKHGRGAAIQGQAPSDTDEYTSFAELLDHYLPESLKPGQLVEGQILRVSHEGILIDIGAKRDAIVPKQEASKLSEAF
jgi:hypothetical protein